MGFIYIRTDSSNHIDNVCKLGQTNNIIDREATYVTGEYIKGKYLLVIEILDEIYDHKCVERLLQIEFTEYHMKQDGGDEFYKKDIVTIIEPFLCKENIVHKKLSNEDIENLERIEQKKNIKIVESRENFIRNYLQNKYIIDIIDELNRVNKVFLKAPTGFGKTHIYYKTIQKMKFNRILFLTPRKNLNLQIVEKKYSSYINDGNYEIIHFSESNDKNALIKKQSNNLNKLIMTSCYQSGKKLLELVINNNLKFDVIIFDEAHFITTWTDKEDIKDFLISNDITKNRIFGSATPTDDIKSKTNIYGNIISKVEVYELMEKEILCNIVTSIKQLKNNNKKDYCDLPALICNDMKKFHKKKGIIYVNTCDNAINLYNSMQKEKSINTYIYISNNDKDKFKKINDKFKNIKNFEDDDNQCIVIAVAKISYGYDNDYIDYICLADPRCSDIDIRQIIGRGLRWNKHTYPNKLLHLLVPIYKDEFKDDIKNHSLKLYLDYIIGECGIEIIIKENNKYTIFDKDKTNNGNEYDGENISSEILQEYCTTGYNKFNDFIKFLKRHNIYDETSYYNLYELNKNWMVPIENLKDKYEKFCFRDIHPDKEQYYKTREEAESKNEIAKDILKKQIGFSKFSKLTKSQLIKKLNEIDPNIPLVDFTYYY